MKICINCNYKVNTTINEVYIYIIIRAYMYDETIKLIIRAYMYDETIKLIIRAYMYDETIKLIMDSH